MARRGATRDNCSHAKLQRLFGYLSETSLAKGLAKAVGIRPDDPPMEPWMQFEQQLMATSDDEPPSISKKPRVKAVTSGPRPPPVLAIQVTGCGAGKVVPLFEVRRGVV